MEANNQKEIMKKIYLKRILLCAIYAVFFTFCIYKNPMGITFPLFALATIIAYFIVFKTINVNGAYKFKKFSVVLVIFIMLLSIHVCTTGSEPLIIFDKIFVFISMFVLFLTNLYDDKNWDVTRYIGAITETVVTALSYLFRPISEGLNISKYGAPVAPVRPQTMPPAPGATPAPGQNVAPAQAAAMQMPAPGQNVAPAQPGPAQDTQPSGAAQPGEKKGTIGYVILGLLISLPLLCIVLPLLVSSDVVFGNTLSNIFDFKINADFFGVIFLTIVIFFYGYALMTRFFIRSSYLDSPVKDQRNANPVIAITVSAVMLFFYLLYCAIQIIYLFLGFGSLPDGYTYAEYAHEGFFQLVFVCLINLVLVLICRKFSKDNLALKILLTIICACTYVMLFSSAYRMILYISVYGLTFLRVYVLWALVVIALVMLGAIALIFNANVPFVKYSLTLLVSTWLVFSFSYPDTIIANYNLSHGYDLYYTTTHLSSDAVPVIVNYRDYIDDHYHAEKPTPPMKRIDEKWGNEEIGIRTFNVSTYRAICAVK